MRLWNPLAATVAIGAILCCGPALARTWTDSTGNTRSTANLSSSPMARWTSAETMESWFASHWKS